MTHARPTSAGYYWYKDSDEWDIVEISWDDYDCVFMVARFRDDCPKSLDDEPYVGRTPWSETLTPPRPKGEWGPKIPQYEGKP